MFDSYYLQTTRETQYVTKEVHEHRAPTDKSVELLNEMQQKTLDNIVKQFSVQNNDFNFSCVAYKNPIKWVTEIFIKFKLNEKEHIVKIDLDNYLDKEGQVKKIYDSICKELAYLMMEPICKALDQRY